ncbi:MAG: TIGR02281 family clan AA aspartic protease [Porticoccaceae bacterium]
MVRRWLLGVCLVSASASVVAAPEVQAIALFRDRAMLEINGVQRLLKAGEMAPEGVRLVASDSTGAVLEIDGKRVRLALSQRIAASYAEAEFAEVRIPRGEQGHHFVGGSINGHGVRFLVDTGATTIAMSSLDAERLGLKWREGSRGVASTASGLAESRELTLATFSIGPITLHRIPATVVTGAYPTSVLLGNSFLAKVEMTEESGVMILRQKY